MIRSSVKWFRRHATRTSTLVSPQEGYRRWARSYGRRPNPFQKMEHEALSALMPAVAGLRVLDFGCGTGRVARLAGELGAAHTVALDRSLAMLAKGRGEDEGQSFLQAQTPALPLRAESFDLVVCALVLGHIEELGPTLEALAALLRPGGVLLISDFHPFATLRGWKRTFRDEQIGRTCEVRQYLHLFEAYVATLVASGLGIDGLIEPQWRGTPVLFVLRARKAGLERP